MAPDILAPRQFGTKQFGTRQFGTWTIWHRTIWHQEKITSNLQFDNIISSIVPKMKKINNELYFRMLGRKVHIKYLFFTQTCHNLTYAKNFVFCRKQIIIHYYLFNCWQIMFIKRVFYPFLCPTGHTNTPKLNL